MQHLELLMALEDCGVSELRHDGELLYFFPAERGGPAPQLPEALKEEVRRQRPFLLANVKRLPKDYVVET